MPSVASRPPGTEREAAAIRPGSPREPGVRALLAEADALSDSLYPPASRHGLSAAALEALDLRFFVAMGGKEGARTAAIGCGGYAITAPCRAELKRLFVTAAVRGRGIGRALLGAIEADARSAGILLLQLETGTGSHAALALYAASGYRRCAPFPPYADDPLSVFLEKPLAAAGAAVPA